MQRSAGDPRWTPQGRFFVGLAIAAIGTLHAFLLRWTCDDAFITFRYLEQWFAGHGLVYNPGERVEGYTHPLWLLLLAGLRLLGLDPVSAATTLGLTSFALLLFFLGRRFPMAALILAVHGEVATWATSGLETALFTAEVAFLAFLVAEAGAGPTGDSAGSPGNERGRSGPVGAQSPRLPGGALGSGRKPAILGSADDRRAATLGALLVVLALTRPDGALLGTAGSVLFLAWTPRGQRLRTVLLVAGVAAILAGPYLAWKLAYYGQLLPNTYYAKSGGGAYWSQGFYYIGTLVHGHPSTTLGLLACAALPRVWRREDRGERMPRTGDVPSVGRGSPEDPRARLGCRDRDARLYLTALVLSITYLVFFVARVGGDFMYARFVVPLLPLLFVAFELGLRAFRPRALLHSLLAVALPLFVLVERPLLRDPLFRDPDAFDGRARLRGIEDERWYWTHDVGGGESQIERYARLGGHFGDFFAGLDVSVSILGQASLGYYGKFPRVVEENGLTEPSIARRPLTTRGRIGHEKRATLDDLRDLGVDLRLLLGRPEDEPYRIVYFTIDDYSVTGELLRYDPSFLARLVGQNPDRILAVAFPAWFDHWLEAEAPRLGRAELEKAARGFEDYYFEFHEDPVRRARLDLVLGRAER